LPPFLKANVSWQANPRRDIFELTTGRRLGQVKPKGMESNMETGSLILARKKHESIHVSGPCVITVTEIRGDQVKLGIEADKAINIRRAELPQIGERKCNH
jgi:carbon storage regulator CsrA